MYRFLGVLVAVALVNLPWAHQAWQHHRISDEGRMVTATVTSSSADGGRHLVQFRLPESIDPGRARYTARLDPAHFRAATANDTVRVRVVPGDPAANRVVGESEGPVVVVIAVIGDAILLLLLAAFWWRRRSRLRDS